MQSMTCMVCVLLLLCQVQGIDAGAGAGAALKAVPAIISGVKNFLDIIKSHQSQDKSNMMEMEQTFERMVVKLDGIELVLQNMLEEMRFSRYKEEILDASLTIGTINRKLKMIAHASNKTHGIYRFNDVYEGGYEEAGTRLVTLILDHHVFEKAAEVKRNYRSKVMDFMVTLMAFLVEARTVEVDYEHYNNLHTGVTQQWLTWISKVGEKMIEVDDGIVREWRKYFVEDVEREAGSLNDYSHKDFSNGMYDFFKAKYPWRHWYILSYDPVSTSKVHTVEYFPPDDYLKFRTFGRNFLVGSTNGTTNSLNISVDTEYSCDHGRYYCWQHAAYILSHLVSREGYTVAVIESSVDWAWKAEPSRYEVRRTILAKYYSSCGFKGACAFGKIKYPMKIIYFG